MSNIKRIDRVGETGVNKQGLQMEIIGYKDRRHVDVLFSDGCIRKGIQYDCFLSGAARSLLYPEFLGVGFFGEGKYKARVNGAKTRAYINWSSMLTRCYSEKYIKRRNYERCSVCSDWLNFQTFAKWHELNYYSVANDTVELDKDIIKKGNDVYSPETCIYVPHKLNTIICNRHNNRGEYPVGICKQKDKYIVSCNIAGNQTYIGSYEIIEDAFAAYKDTKEREIRRAAEAYRNIIPDYIIDHILAYRVEITD